MVKKTRGIDFLGKWAFLIGVLLAIIIGLFNAVSGTGAIILALIGLIVGLLNVGGEEVMPFLMSGAVLIIASAFGGGVMSTIPYAGSIFSALLVVFVPATIIVAIKNVFNLAKN